jgi:hypothetical protein
VDAWCTRCRLELGHRIVAMVAGVPKRVLCMTCNSEHNYRVPPGTADARAVRRTPGTSSKTGGTSKNSPRPTKARAMWEAEIRSGKPIRAYTTASSFQVGQLVSHSKFGTGYVADVPSPTKVVIAFESGPKTLLQNS